MVSEKSMAIFIYESLTSGRKYKDIEKDIINGTIKDRGNEDGVYETSLLWLIRMVEKLKPVYGNSYKSLFRVLPLDRIHWFYPICMEMRDDEAVEIINRWVSNQKGSGYGS